MMQWIEQTRLSKKTHRWTGVTLRYPAKLKDGNDVSVAEDVFLFAQLRMSTCSGVEGELV
jgi:hypothetical protein